MFNKQEKFWKGKFGDFYTKRNSKKSQLLSNINFFKNILKNQKSIRSILELGCNRGLNLKALKCINGKYKLTGVDINKDAIEKLRRWGEATTYNSDIKSLRLEKKFDLVFTKGVLIHVNPKNLKKIYNKLYSYSKKYILLAEYYNPTPVSVLYRGHKGKLFKRDFADDMLNIYRDLSLVKYGFCYHKDKMAPQDDINWFLLKKK